jgi:hypothetical protein
MDKHAMTEQDMSEEQLQQITGGCGACEVDRLRIMHHATFANLNDSYSQIARDFEYQNAAKEYAQQARMHSLTAKLIQERIDARHPAGSEIAELAAKKQRLQ